MLSPEAQPRETPAAQRLSHQDLRQGKPPPKLAGALDCFVMRDHPCNLSWNRAVSGAPPPSFGWSPSPEGEDYAATISSAVVRSTLTNCETPRSGMVTP
jgi:hypothetical protein